MHKSRLIVGMTICGAVAPGVMAQEADRSSMTVPAGSTATIRVILTVTTGLGTSSDDDTRTMTSTGTANAVFTPLAPPFGAAQFDTMQMSFSNTTFVFQLFCLPFIGCQTLNVNVTDLMITAAAPFWAPAGAGGAVFFSGALFHTTGGYSTSGLATASGPIDSTAPSDFSGRITNPTGTTVRLDQLVMAQQTIVVPPDQLPAGITALSFVIQPTLTNTTFSGPFVPLVPDFNADQDVDVDLADYATLFACLTGPDGGLATPGCAVHDAASDHDVDLLDVAEFQTDFGAPP